MCPRFHSCNHLLGYPLVFPRRSAFPKFHRQVHSQARGFPRIQHHDTDAFQFASAYWNCGVARHVSANSHRHHYEKRASPHHRLETACSGSESVSRLDLWHVGTSSANFSVTDCSYWVWLMSESYELGVGSISPIPSAAVAGVRP